MKRIRQGKRKKPFVQRQFDVFPSYKGGSTIEVEGGYIFEFCPGHHLQNRWGFVGQHRLVAEDKLGRRLERGEHVHHKDGCPHNNHPDNLEAMSNKDHLALHRPERFVACKKDLDPSAVAEALQLFGLKGAAKHLKVHTQTLRNRFPELVASYKRHSPTLIDDPETIRLVLKLAADPNMGYKDIARQTGIAAMTVLRICRKNGAMWIKKTRKGEVRRTYRGKPTPRWLELHGHKTAPGLFPTLEDEQQA